MEIHLSIIVPFYNEENRLRLSLPLILAFIRQQPFVTELILSNDGSTDHSMAVVSEILKNESYRVLSEPVNQGKGNAVKRGMLAAQGRYVLFSDADLSTPLEEILRFIPYFDKGYDIVIGSRSLASSKVEVHQNALRELMGRVFNLSAQCLTFKNIRDSQCGFKCFTQSAARALFSLQQIPGFAFDAEILYLAQKMGYRIQEEPVLWRNETQSRVKLFSDPIKMFWDLLRIRWIHRRNH
ncbi:MAG: glycosyltransferase family 2 protein [Candidatus Omnitrophica bacterium]|nr:glycosyltransferase family 2 protein [Candidatus Omnitrophota bacterium]